MLQVPFKNSFKLTAAQYHSIGSTVTKSNDSQSTAPFHHHVKGDHSHIYTNKIPVPSGLFTFSRHAYHFQLAITIYYRQFQTVFSDADGFNII